MRVEHLPFAMHSLEISWVMWLEDPSYVILLILNIFGIERALKPDAKGGEGYEEHFKVVLVLNF
jgi:hypothetical protein